MRILTYKRTHTGDPNAGGKFGVNDCMGRVRGLQYDAVIGVGGVGAEPRSYQIDGKITWVGIGPKKRQSPWLAPVVTFDRFVLFDSAGPLLASLAPRLARRVYGGKVRYILSGYSSQEQEEAEGIVRWVLEATQTVRGHLTKTHKGIILNCVCKSHGSQVPPSIARGRRARTMW